MDGSCIYIGNPTLMWTIKIICLILLVFFLSLSLYVYYKSLNNMKHKDLSGR